MPRIPLPAPCHLCGQTCVSSRRGRVVRRLDRADFATPAEHTDADTCPWRQCPHRPRGRPPTPVIEDQRSYGVVAAPWPPAARPPVVLSLHPDRGAAESDRERLLLIEAARPSPRTARQPRIDYDVVEFPHALIASQLDAAQEEGYEYGYEHGRETAREQLAETEPDPCAHTALRDLADRHPQLLADTIRHLTGAARDIARAVAESVRLGYPLDPPLMRALAASAPQPGRAS